MEEEIPVNFHTANVVSQERRLRFQTQLMILHFSDIQLIWYESIIKELIISKF